MGASNEVGNAAEDEPRPCESDARDEASRAEETAESESIAQDDSTSTRIAAAADDPSHAGSIARKGFDGRKAEGEERDEESGDWDTEGETDEGLALRTSGAKVEGTRERGASTSAPPGQPASSWPAPEVNCLTIRELIQLAMEFEMHWRTYLAPPSTSRRQVTALESFWRNPPTALDEPPVVSKTRGKKSCRASICGPYLANLRRATASAAEFGVADNMAFVIETSINV